MNLLLESMQKQENKQIYFVLIYHLDLSQQERNWFDLYANSFDFNIIPDRKIIDEYMEYKSRDIYEVVNFKNNLMNECNRLGKHIYACSRFGTNGEKVSIDINYKEGGEKAPNILGNIDNMFNNDDNDDLVDF